MTNKLLKGVFAKKILLQFHGDLIKFCNSCYHLRSESNGKIVTGNDFFPPTHILRSLCLIKCIKNAWLSHMVLSK